MIVKKISNMRSGIRDGLEFNGTGNSGQGIDCLGFDGPVNNESRLK